MPLWGVPNAVERGTKLEQAHKWPRWLHSPYRLGVPNQQGTQSQLGHKWARWLTNHCRLRGPQRFTAGDTIRRGPPVGRVAT